MGLTESLEIGKNELKIFPPNLNNSFIGSPEWRDKNINVHFRINQASSPQQTTKKQKSIKQTSVEKAINFELPKFYTSTGCNGNLPGT